MMRAWVCKTLCTLIFLAAAPTLAKSDDRITCVVSIDDSRWLPETYGKAAQERCGRDDIIFGSIEKGSKISGVVFYAAAVCRVDRQIIVSSDGRDFMCAFRGEARQVRSLFGSAPAK